MELALRRAWLWSAGLGLAAIAVFFVDGPAGRTIASWRGSLGGDVRRELEAVQQYGQFTITVLVLATIWLLDPGRRRRLLDYLAAMGLTALVVLPVKLLAGRPRPRFDDPGFIAGPWRTYPIPHADPPGTYHAWDLSAPISSDLWSLPSSHTAYAVVLSVFLGALYPALRPVVIVLAVTVACARVLFGAHWPSDVLAGASIALACSSVSVYRLWGVRGLDWLWVRLVDRTSRPAAPAVVEREAERTPEGQRG